MLIAVDFDGTIVTHEYPKIGREIPFAIDTLKRLQSELHHQLVLWTMRDGKELDEAVEYCRARGWSSTPSMPATRRKCSNRACRAR